MLLPAVKNVRGSMVMVVYTSTVATSAAATLREHVIPSVGIRCIAVTKIVTLIAVAAAAAVRPVMIVHICRDMDSVTVSAGIASISNLKFRREKTSATL
jgi:hypothetical protein